MADLDVERLFAEHAQALYGFLAYRVADPGVAEDLLGDTFERVVRSARSYDRRKGGEQTWLYTIALNCLRDHQRRNKVELAANERALPTGQDMSGGLDALADRDLLMRGLDELDPGEREILALRYGADLRLRDIAIVTGLPETTVQGRLYSGLRKLREVLDRDQARTSGS